MSQDPRVLSIQSHVVSGYVGNKCSTFSLQILGFDVDAINSVQFSNHTGYLVWTGQILNSDELGDLFDGLRSNNIHHYSHLLTGYIGSKSFLIKVTDVIDELRRKNPGLIYVCDPVMGDNGQMYVPEELLQVYREQIIPRADIITPNQFETDVVDVCRLLTGVKITSIETALEAMKCLHSMGAKTVVISSSELGTDDILVGLGSSVSNGTRALIRVDMPRIPALFTGSGDLFAALLLAWLHKHPDNLQLACEKTVSTMQHVLIRTVQYSEDLRKQGIKLDKSHLELRLIQSKADIEDPVLCVKAQALSL